MNSSKSAWVSGVIAYLLWGALPLFWKHLSHVDPLTVLANRVVWCTALLALVMIATRSELMKRNDLRRELVRYSIAALFLSVNWGTYIFAVSNSKVLAASLGYFLAPLLYIVVGRIWFGERLPIIKRIAALLGLVGLVYMAVGSDFETMVIAASLAATIVVYGTIKKKGTLGAFDSLFVESVAMVLPAATFLMWRNGTQFIGTDLDLQSAFLLLLSGPATLVPLLFFARAIRGLPFWTIGFLQYLSPILQFLIAAVVLGEPITTDRLVAFSFVWCGIALVVTSEGASRLRSSSRHRTVTTSTLALESE